MKPTNIRNPNPRPTGHPCPRCQAIRPKDWKGPCIHCLNARTPRPHRNGTQ